MTQRFSVFFLLYNSSHPYKGRELKKFETITTISIHTILIFYLACLLTSSTALSDTMKSPWELKVPHKKGNPYQNTSFTKLPVQFLLRFYQKFIGPTKGRYCPMYPSCSQYSLEAIRRYGLIHGLLMTADRLHRCSHDILQYPVIDTPAGARFADPVHLNTIGYYRRQEVTLCH